MKSTIEETWVVMLVALVPASETCRPRISCRLEFRAALPTECTARQSVAYRRTAVKPALAIREMSVEIVSKVLHRPSEVYGV